MPQCMANYPQLQLESLRHGCPVPAPVPLVCAEGKMLHSAKCRTLGVSVLTPHPWAATSSPSTCPTVGLLSTPKMESGQNFHVSHTGWNTLFQGLPPHGAGICQVFHFYIGGVSFLGTCVWSTLTDIAVVLCSSLRGMCIPRRREQPLKHGKHRFKKKLLLFFFFF